MRKPEQTPEPSIEEILASIRKIIADDSSSAPQAVYDDKARQPDLARAAPSHQRQSAYYDEDYNSSAASHEDEILELTEDFMVAEENARAAGQPVPAPVKGFSEEENFAAAPRASLEAGEAPPRSASPQPEGRLENVLSNVVAEVQRLSPEANDMPERLSTPATSAPAPKAPTPLTTPIGNNAAPPAEDDAFGKPPFGVEPPVTPAPRQFWSARRGEAAKQPLQRGPQQTEQPEAQKQSAPPAPPVNQEARAHDKWAQGVQMPVPESGPAVPFSHSEMMEEKGFSDTDDNAAKSADLEKERSFVGEMLTRVFRSSSEKSAEKAFDYDPGEELDEEDDRSRAARLAKSTIADFADEQLGAPVVADALHADQPFMDAITDSISATLPKSQRGAPADKPRPVMDTAKIGDEKPELGISAHEDAGQPFGIPAEHLHGLPSFEMPPAQSAEPHPFDASKPMDADQDTPELPSEEFQDMPDLAEASGKPSLFAVPPSRESAAPARPEFGQKSEAQKSAETLQFRQERVAKRIEEFTADESPAGGEFPLRAEMPVEKPQAAPVSAPPSSSVPSAAQPEPQSSLTAASFPAGFDDQVKELLKPLIIQWLDTNMPRIVEKAVREEVAAKGLRRDTPDRR